MVIHVAAQAETPEYVLWPVAMDLITNIGVTDFDILGLRTAHDSSLAERRTSCLSRRRRCRGEDALRVAPEPTRSDVPWLNSPSACSTSVFTDAGIPARTASNPTEAQRGVTGSI